MDLISMVEATLEIPKAGIARTGRAARSAMAEMKADGVDYEERLERIQDVTYEKPLEICSTPPLTSTAEEVPWANDYQLSPKSVLRDMLESASDFKGYIQKLGIARSEGILLRYPAEAYRSLDRTVPIEKARRAPARHYLVAGLCGALGGLEPGGRVGKTPATRQPLDAAPPQGHRRGRGGPSRLHAIGAQRALPPRDPCRPRACSRPGRARRRLGHERDPLAKSTRRLPRAARGNPHRRRCPQRRDVFHRRVRREDRARMARAHQIFADEDGDHDFGIMGDVDLDATQDGGEVIFKKNYRVGFIEDLLED